MGPSGLHARKSGAWAFKSRAYVFMKSGLEWHSKSFHAVCSKGGLLLLENILQCMECSSLAIKLLR